MLPPSPSLHAAARTRRGRWATLAALLASCAPARPPEPPQVVLWAWERPEDLRFLTQAGHPVSVAFLLATLSLTDAEVLEPPRRQPLHVPPGTPLKATVRMEAQPGASLARYSPERLHALADRLATLARRPELTALQLDFDARASEYDAYVAMLQALRQKLPPSVSLSITGLASWCTPGSWLTRAPVDEVVPQLFRMGPEAPTWRARFARGLPAPCRGSVGLALDEWQAVPPGVSTLYVFNPHPWTPEAFSRVVAEHHP
ncbi:DUF3142 domain-containing protein [Myxococcus sp. 1LA]